MALVLLTTSVPPAPLIVFTVTKLSPLSVPVPAVSPLVPEMVRVTPEGINVVWKLLVWPKTTDPTVAEASTTLSIKPALAAAPGSKNCTSLLEPGTPLGDQLPTVDQLVLTPA